MVHIVVCWITLFRAYWARSTTSLFNCPSSGLHWASCYIAPKPLAWIAWGVSAPSPWERKRGSTKYKQMGLTCRRPPYLTGSLCSFFRHIDRVRERQTAGSRAVWRGGPEEVPGMHEMLPVHWPNMFRSSRAVLMGKRSPGLVQVVKTWCAWR